jgi:hypothetical protein
MVVVGAELPATPIIARTQNITGFGQGIHIHHLAKVFSTDHKEPQIAILPPTGSLGQDAVLHIL